MWRIKISPVQVYSPVMGLIVCVRCLKFTVQQIVQAVSGTEELKHQLKSSQNKIFLAMLYKYRFVFF